MTQIVLNGVYRGKIAQRFGMRTAMDKTSTEETIFLSKTGLEGDECAEQRFHGGPERALHQYPAEHYSYWLERFEIDVDWKPCGMGENMSSEGMLETNVCIGDQYQWGDAIIEVSQPRSPCFKLSKRWGIEDFAVTMQEISRCGWLYRVIKEGQVSVKQPVELIHRPDNAMTIKQVCDIYFGDPLNKEGLSLLLNQPHLSDSWRSKVEERLETGIVENWNFRLLGHA
ncbi:MOSC domain-containing protein [Vibrio sonorensis]|uniref:MOSC domain-containing protein n=1 Tax=Vibrio sonorensis TaxID=1004316 RepID=UPI0008D9A62D|nr:MOSC domain-containing protein [Vibrio sonorensis]